MPMTTQADSGRNNYAPGISIPISESLKYQAHKSPSDLVRVGIFGYGYWGPNVVRNLHALENWQVVIICDKNPAALKRANTVYPGVNMTTDSSGIMTSPESDTVAIVTQVGTHFERAKPVLP